MNVQLVSCCGGWSQGTPDVGSDQITAEKAQLWIRPHPKEVAVNVQKVVQINK